MGQWVKVQGQVNVAKNLKTCPHCDVTSRKRQIKNYKRFFRSQLEDLLNACKGFEQLSSSSGWRFLAKKGQPIAAFKA